MELYIVEDVTKRVSAPLCALGHDAIHTDEVGRKGRTDPRQLAFAAAQGRVLATCNLNDFVLLHEAWLLCPHGQPDPSRTSPAGIAIVPNSSRISDEESVSVIDRFARDFDSPSGRLFRWRRDHGWQEVSV